MTYGPYDTYTEVTTNEGTYGLRIGEVGALNSDGEWIVVTADEGEEYSEAYLMSLSKGELRAILADYGISRAKRTTKAELIAEILAQN